MSEADGAAHVASTMGRITPSTDVGALSECDVLIEAVIEDLSLKESLYRQIGSVVGDQTIIASNTSSLSIGVMAGYCGRPKQMIGLHFFNPVQLMKLVEVWNTQPSP